MAPSSSALLRSAKLSCIRAGKAVLECFDRSLTPSHGGYRTPSDVEANGSILSDLVREHPDMPIVSEEGGVGVPGNGPFWIVDPLDGTWNYHHGGSKWAISIAATDGGSLLCGVVHAPMLGETYEFARGMADPLLNGRPIGPSRSSFPGEWTVTAGAPSEAKERAGAFLENIRRPLDTGDPKRPAIINAIMYGRGSMALELCHLASGRIDGTLRFAQRRWDLAGGACIALGSGCTLETLDGERLSDVLCLSNARDSFDILGASDPSNASFLRRMASGEVRAWPDRKKK